MINGTAGQTFSYCSFKTMRFSFDYKLFIISHCIFTIYTRACWDVPCKLDMFTQFICQSWPDDANGGPALKERLINMTYLGVEVIQFYHGSHQRSLLSYVFLRILIRT